VVNTFLVDDYKVFILGIRSIAHFPFEIDNLAYFLIRECSLSLDQLLPLFCG